MLCQPLPHFCKRVAQGDIIYEVDNFVVFRQPFNLWASVFNGLCSTALALMSLLRPDAMCRQPRILHTHHASKTQHQSK